MYDVGQMGVTNTYDDKTSIKLWVCIDPDRTQCFGKKILVSPWDGKIWVGGNSGAQTGAKDKNLFGESIRILRWIKAWLSLFLVDILVSSYKLKYYYCITKNIYIDIWKGNRQVNRI